MRRCLTWAGPVLLGAVLALVGAGMAWAQGSISGSPHDFSSAGWNTTSQICVVCHTPHGANTNVSGAPLWNRRLTAATFTPYSSDTLNATVGQPDGVSKLCLSCHDGTVGLESFGSAGSLNSWTDPGVGTNTIDANHLVGTDLRNDHPISFTYDTALMTADGGLKDPTTLTGVKLFGGKVQCASCHDVHNKAAVEAPLLRVTLSGSALCLKCHDK